jgi:hypothetical protein
VRLLLPGVLIALALARASLQVTSGLSAEYFANERFTGTPAHRTVDRELSTARILAGWVGDPPPTFSVAWQGYLTVPRAGEYTLATTSDDGSRVMVGARVVVDNGGQHAAVTRTGRVRLEAAAHRVRIEFEQHGGPFEMALRMDGEPVPSWLLSTQPRPIWALRAARMIEWLMAAAGAATVAWLMWLLIRSRRSVVSAIARHPRFASLLLFVGLAVVETWPLARHPARLSRNDNSDTILNEWVLAWVAHQAPRAPLHLYDANIFHPERDTLAYSESMIVQSAMGAPLHWLGASPVFVYNVLLMAGMALTGWSLCLVISRWTGDWSAGLLSGVLAAFNAHTITTLPHLQGQHMEFLAPALLALDALLRGGGVRDALRLAGWFTLQALTSVHLMIFTTFALIAGVLARPRDWLGPRFGRTAGLIALAAGAALVALLPFLLPYWRVSSGQGLSRTLEEQARMSAGWRDYLTTAGTLHYELWSHRFTSSTGLFPGVVGLALTTVAFARGVALSDPRARMCAAFGSVALLLSFGPAVPGYATLYEVLLPLHGIRAVARFGYIVLFAVAALAGFGLVEVRRLAPARAWPAIPGVLVAFAVIEPLAAPLTLTRANPISPIYATVASSPDAVIAEIPFYGGAAAHAQARYLLNSTAHWKPMVNGYSGAAPASFHDRVEALAGFPDAVAIAALRNAGVTHVFVHVDRLPSGILGAIAQVPALEELESLDGIVLYRLNQLQSR